MSFIMVPCWQAYFFSNTENITFLNTHTYCTTPFLSGKHIRVHLYNHIYIISQKHRSTCSVNTFNFHVHILGQIEALKNPLFVIHTFTYTIICRLNCCKVYGVSYIYIFFKHIMQFSTNFEWSYHSIFKDGWWCVFIVGITSSKEIDIFKKHQSFSKW